MNRGSAAARCNLPTHRADPHTFLPTRPTGPPTQGARRPHRREARRAYFANNSLASKPTPRIACTVVSRSPSGSRRSAASGSGCSEGAR